MSEFDIEIQCEVSLPREIEAVLGTAVRLTLAHEGVVSPAGLTLLITSDERMEALNHAFLGEEGPTDVLSFPSGETGPTVGEMPPYLGDIVIALPYASRQAELQGHDLVAELQLLAIHGTLHLLGYDHGSTAEKQRMWAAQAAVLGQLGLSHVVPIEE